MAEFDAIFEEDVEEERYIDDFLVEPVVVRGAGNMTVLVFFKKAV